MGVETAIIIGLSAASAVGQISNAKREAKDVVKQGNLETANKAKQVIARTAAAQSSFLNSGLTLEGTPSGALNSMFDSGIADIQQIGSNYNSKAKSIISQGRTAALGTLAGAFAGASFGSGGLTSAFEKAGSYLPDSFAYGLNDLGFGESSFNMLDMSDKRLGIGAYSP